MPQPPRSLAHPDFEKKSDEALANEARNHLADAPALQLVAELVGKLRALSLAWWTPDDARARWSATDRMRWYATRPDLRQAITTRLTGLAPRAARKKTPEFQGALIDSAIDEGDTTARAFEDAFDPCDLAVYAPAAEIWRAFVDRMPWGDDAPAHQELCAWLFDALLADRSGIEGLYRKPILTAWEARTAIDGRVWHTRMPLEIRVAIDEARFAKQRERPNEPFHAESDLSIAVAATIAASIPLRDLQPVFLLAADRMGFAKAPREPARASMAPPPPASMAPPPPAPMTRSVPPPAASRPPPSMPSQPPPKAEPAKVDPAKPPPARAALGTIPDALKDIPAEEERTNPWDIPTDATGKG
jgi:hypothetical protein